MNPNLVYNVLANTRNVGGGCLRLPGKTPKVASESFPCVCTIERSAEKEAFYSQIMYTVLCMYVYMYVCMYV